MLSTYNLARHSAGIVKGLMHISSFLTEKQLKKQKTVFVEFNHPQPMKAALSHRKKGIVSPVQKRRSTPKFQCVACAAVRLSNYAMYMYASAALSHSR
jgi:hypothetical protein